MSVHKKIQPKFGPAVWPAIGNIYIYANVLFYYIDLMDVISTLGLMQYTLFRHCNMSLIFAKLIFVKGKFCKS